MLWAIAIGKYKLFQSVVSSRSLLFVFFCSAWLFRWFCLLNSIAFSFLFNSFLLCSAFLRIFDSHFHTNAHTCTLHRVAWTKKAKLIYVFALFSHWNIGVHGDCRHSPSLSLFLSCGACHSLSRVRIRFTNTLLHDMRVKRHTIDAFMNNISSAHGMC